MNRRDADAIRSGFTTEIINQKGVFGFSAGREELELAQSYHVRAEALEAKGFSRFATAMRELANSYEREAELQAKRGRLDD